MTDYIKAQDACQLLDNPLLKDAFRSVETDIVEALKRVEATDLQSQQSLIIALQQLQKVEASIRQFIETGQIQSFNDKQKNKVI